MVKKQCFAGIDVGTSYIKTVLLNENDDMVGSFIQQSGANLQVSITSAFEGLLNSSGVTQKDITNITATGFGRDNVSFATNNKTEISCHAKGAYHFFPKKITVIDIGGQDTEVIKIDAQGKIIGFKMNRKCAAGTGVFLEEIVHKLDIPLSEMNALVAKSTKKVTLSSFCTVFASTEILTRIKEGEKVEDMLRSAFESVAKRVIEMDTFDDIIVVSGGVIEYNDLLVDILEQLIGKKILISPHPQLTGAIGAALYAKEGTKK